MKKKLVVSLFASLLAPSLYAGELELDDVSVSVSGFKRKDTEATYTSEIHTAKQIAKSGASTLFDYLAQQTSLNIQPSFGNRATPSVNLRGFGGENGFQNVVIMVDGQRLNNIDGAPQLLAGIPLSNIERIEISKGSGSVRFGDGATSGAIQIYTKSKSGVTVTTSWGNFGQQNSAISAGFSEQQIELSMNAAHDSYDGFSKPDATGHRDNFDSNTQNAKIKIKPTDDFRIFAQATNSRNDIRYVNPLTLQQFQNNPRSVGLDFSGNISTYTHQALNSTRWQIGAEYDLSSAWRIDASHTREEKLSDFINFSTQYNYIYESDIINLRYDTESLSAITGFQKYTGERSASNNNTTKDNRAFFANFEYRPIEDWTLSAGIRTEKVDYAYNPDGGLSLKDSKSLHAWDTGMNYRVDPQLSIFANYNDAFQAPDIDRFFNTDFSTGMTSFNGFIRPMHSKTSNVGFNHTTNTNRLKVSAFYIDLNDEIFYDPILGTFGTNTNIARSHKYGVELQDTLEINEKLSTSFQYNYVQAFIDNKGYGSNTYNGKALPGVPHHNIIANLNWKLIADASINLNQTWRSKAYAYNDFANNLSQKQPVYSSTNLAINYSYQKVTVFAAINNIFKHKNAIVTGENAIYPFDFVRTIRLGLRADF